MYYVGGCTEMSDEMHPCYTLVNLIEGLACVSLHLPILSV